MTSKRMPRHVAVLDVRPFNWQIVLVNQRRHFAPVLKHLGRGIDEDIIGNAQGLCTRIAERRTIVLGVFVGASSTLVHELTHAVIAILEFCGQPIHYDGSEIASYLMADLFQRCTDALNAHR